MTPAAAGYTPVSPDSIRPSARVRPCSSFDSMMYISFVPARMRGRVLGAVILAAIMVLSGFSILAFGPVQGAGPVPSAPGTSIASSPSIAAPVATPPSALSSGAASSCPSLESTQNDPGYAAYVQHVQSIAHAAVSDGLPSSDLHLPYTGAIADQVVNGVPMSGSALTTECAGHQPTTSQTAPPGVSYDGQTDISTLQDKTLDSNSIAATLTVNSPTQNFYPGSGTPTVWGAQENVVLPNVTILGQQCPTEPCSASGNGNYAFWVQNTLSYDSHNDTLYFVDDTWNFTNYQSSMFQSSLVDWSPLGGNYTGVWVAFSQYYTVKAPFTVTMYVNTSVDAAGDQILWYNYSVATPTEFIGNGNYDYLVFNSQPAGGHLALSPPDFEASANTYHLVPEDYEFDAFIGADDGSNQLMLAAHATMTVKYCDRAPYCTSSQFAYANVPAAVDFGSETGEQAIGIAVSYVGTTAHLNAGPLVLQGLWNYTGLTGVKAGSTEVVNNIRVVGDPEGPLSSQPYVFVFLEDTADPAQGYQWAPDQPAWYLMPGTYRYDLLLSDYKEVRGTFVVGTTTTSLIALLPYDAKAGVYTPLWAFGNGQLAGISSKGSGSLANPFVPFNNPTNGYDGYTDGALSPYFFSFNDYDYPSFSGVLFSGTTAYVDLNAPPSFAVPAGGGTYLYLGLEFYQTSHVTLSHDTFVQGWAAWSEISFYISVPASQNPVPEAEVSFWDSTDALVMSNDFVGTEPFGGSVAPDGLVLYGGTNNVVWGNTFTDPPGTSLHVRGQYAGLGLGEGGDLIYNNNFSVDNPVVYLPYNWPNVADCLPQSLGPCGASGHDNSVYYNDAANVRGNTWNVTPQPASNIVHVVNGHPLSGNVLGSLVTTQGGNYYWNYGTGANGYSRYPYVSRFYYSDWSNIFPLGCTSVEPPGAPCGTPPPIVGAFENGIATGGDYAPYGPMLSFQESGLPYGTEWSVTIHGVTYSTHTGRLLVAEPYGSEGFAVSASGWSAYPASGTAFAEGVTVVPISFAIDG